MRSSRKTVGPTEAYCAVTYRCNCRCVMCDVWKKETTEEVEPSFYFRLPTSLRLVNLTGGEPFLRRDLPEIAEAITDRCRGVRLHVSTNGLATDRIVTQAARIARINRRTGVRVSLDGVGATHDRMRGVPGAYEKAINTMDRLRKAGIKDLGFAFTMARGNERHLMAVRNQARRMGVDFSTAIVHSAPAFFGEQGGAMPDPDEGAVALTELRDAQLRRLRPKQWFRAYFTDGQIDHLRGRPRRIRCDALREFFFLDPTGDVYPCPVLQRPVGNLADGSLAELVAGDATALAQVDRCDLHCWMVCTARPIMRRNIPAVLRWVASRRLRLARA